jgi:predicted RNase H-like HicB family nuclease
MTDIVQATVVETPRPERPEVWAMMYVRTDGTIGCCEAGSRELVQAYFDAHAEAGDFIAHIPGTRAEAAGAGDAVAELVEMGHEVRIGKANGGYWCMVPRPREDDVVRRGETQESAARAALEAIRATEKGAG